MKTLDRLMLKSYLGPMVLTFFIVVFIFVMQGLWLRIDEMVGKGLSIGVILEFIFWMAMTSIPMALPLSTLLASIMTLGNLGEFNELLALKAAGISLLRIIRPLMIFIFFVSIAAFFISNNLLPYANLSMRTLLNDIKKKSPELAIEEQVFTNSIPGFSIKVDEKDSKTGLLKGVIAYDHSKGAGNNSVTIAESGYIRVTADQKYLVTTLYNGNTYDDEDKLTSISTQKYGFQRRAFSEQTAVIALEGVDFVRSDGDNLKGVAMMKNLNELNYTNDSLSTLQYGAAKEYTSNFVSSNVFSSYQELEFIEDESKRPVYVRSSDTDSLFAALPLEKQVAVLNRAVNLQESETLQNMLSKSDMLYYLKELNAVRLVWNQKFTLSVACIVFFFIGAPLGAIIRKGGLGAPLVISILFFIVYWVIDITAVKMARSGNADPVIAAWFSTLVLVPIGIFLTYKSATDSSLFNTDKYAERFAKIVSFFKKKPKQTT